MKPEVELIEGDSEKDVVKCVNRSRNDFTHCSEYRYSIRRSICTLRSSYNEDFPVDEMYKDSGNSSSAAVSPTVSQDSGDSEDEVNAQEEQDISSHK